MPGACQCPRPHTAGVDTGDSFRSWRVGAGLRRRSEPVLGPRGKDGTVSPATSRGRGGLCGAQRATTDGVAWVIRAVRFDHIGCRPPSCSVSTHDSEHPGLWVPHLGRGQPKGVITDPVDLRWSEHDSKDVLELATEVRRLPSLAASRFIRRHCPSRHCRSRRASVSCRGARLLVDGELRGQAQLVLGEWPIWTTHATPWPTAAAVGQAEQ